MKINDILSKLDIKHDEDEKEDKAVEKGAMDIINPHKGLNNKDKAKGRVQLNLLDLAQARQLSKDGLKNQKDLEDRAEEHAKTHPHQELPKKEEIAKQLRLGLQESSHARKQGVGVKGLNTVDSMGTKYFKDGAQMHPNSISHSNGESGRYLGTNGGRDYADYDEKKELQQKIKNDGHQSHKNQARELSNRDANKPVSRGPENKDYRNGQHDNIGTNASFRAQAKLANKLRLANVLDEELEKDGPKGEVKPLKSAPKTGYFDKKIETAKTNFRTADKVARNEWKKFKASDDIDSSGYSDTYANAKTADNEREEALDNYKYTRDKMNAERKGKAINPKRTHMNDKNSKIEQALKTIAEADQMLAQPVAPVQVGEIYKNAQDAENKPELPTTFDHQDLARALKANYKNTKEDEK